MRGQERGILDAHSIFRVCRGEQQAEADSKTSGRGEGYRTRGSLSSMKARAGVDLSYRISVEAARRVKRRRASDGGRHGAKASHCHAGENKTRAGSWGQG